MITVIFLAILKSTVDVLNGFASAFASVAGLLNVHFNRIATIADDKYKSSRPPEEEDAEPIIVRLRDTGMN